MEYCWQESKRNISQRGAYILETGLSGDVEFLVGSEEDKKIIPAHMLILAMGSHVFEAMFALPRKENEPIPLPDITPNIFSKVLKYIYADEVSYGDVKEALELYFAAEKYCIPHLKDECNIYFDSFLLFPHNVCQVLETARSFGIEHLEQRCLTFISACTSEVLRSKGFLNAKKEILQLIFRMDEVTVDSEAEFLYALLSWVKTECIRSNLEQNPRNMKKIMETLIPFIFFWKMPTRDFRNAMNSASDIFDWKETFQIYMKRAFRRTKFYRLFRTLCIKSQKKRIICPGSLVNIDLRKGRFTESEFRIQHRTIPSSIVYLQSRKDTLKVKGIAFHWISSSEQEDERIHNQKPEDQSFKIRAINPNTGVEVNTNITLTTGTDVKLVFGNFIPVRWGEIVKFIIDIHTDQFENCYVWCANGRCTTRDFTIF